MRRFLILLLIGVFGAMPLVGVSKTLNADAQDAQEMQDMKDMPCHQSAPKSPDESNGDCDYCKGASHCCAGFLLPAPAFEPAAAPGATRFVSRAALAAGIVIPPLEPPPLAS
jgi:hypothetical protein